MQHVSSAATQALGEQGVLPTQTRSQFITIPTVMLDDTRVMSSPATLRLYAVLQSYANPQGLCWPSMAELCDRIGIKDRATVSRQVQQLAKWGYISIKRRRLDRNTNLTNMYWINPQPQLGNNRLATLPHERVGGCWPETNTCWPDADMGRGVETNTCWPQPYGEPEPVKQQQEKGDARIVVGREGLQFAFTDEELNQLNVTELELHAEFPKWEDYNLTRRTGVELNKRAFKGWLRQYSDRRDRPKVPQGASKGSESTKITQTPIEGLTVYSGATSDDLRRKWEKALAYMSAQEGAGFLQSYFKGAHFLGLTPEGAARLGFASSFICERLTQHHDQLINAAWRHASGCTNPVTLETV